MNFWCWGAGGSSRKGFGFLLFIFILSFWGGWGYGEAGNFLGAIFSVTSFMPLFHLGTVEKQHPGGTPGGSCRGPGVSIWMPSLYGQPREMVLLMCSFEWGGERFPKPAERAQDLALTGRGVQGRGKRHSEHVQGEFQEWGRR